MEDIEDTTNLIGISSLINRKHADDKLDFYAIEKSCIGASGVRIIPESDPAQEFKNTIRELSTDTGINLDDEAFLSGDEGSEGSRRSRSSRGSRGSGSYSGSGSGSRSRSGSGSEYDSQEGSYSGSEYDSQEGSYSGSYSGSEYEEDAGHSREPRERDSGRTLRNMEYNEHSSRNHRKFGSGLTKPGTPRPNSSQYVPRHSQSRYPSRYESRDNHYESRDGHLDEAIKAYSGTSKDVNLEEENQEEIKAVLLEDIDELKVELESDGVDISRIQEVDKDSHMEDVRKIHKMLRMKYDRKRCNSFGTELILAGAQGLEYVFDGKHSFGPYRPDLTGWSSTIRPKLRRMKYETSTVVANIMAEYNIGPMARIGLELFPSAILYSRMRRDQHGKNNYSPDELSHAFEDLREFDN